MTRRGAIALGVLGVAAAGVAAAPQIPAAYAANYPSWPDVQKAMANESTKKAEIGKIEGLIANLQGAAARAKAAAEQAGNEFFQAQQDFVTAAQRADDLQSQADSESARAKDAADKAGQVAAQLYRNGGDSTTLQLLLSGSAANADDLLARLGTMDKLLEANRAVYSDAVAARDSAQSLSNQAAEQRKERDRLQKIAQKKMVAAQQASDAADAAVANESAHLDDLQGQLAALKDTTAKTVAGYKAGVEARRKAEEERKRRAAAERRRQEEAARKAAAAAAAAAAKNNSGGGGGGGSPASAGVGVVTSGWCRPSSGWQSSGYGYRYAQCGSGYCATSFHEGVDLAAACGAPIYAAHSGRVTYAGYNGGYGNYIRLDHGGGTGTGYGHIRNGGIYVRYGQQVRAGQVIAAEGNTGHSFGCHLHFETYVNGAPVNPVTFMAARGISV
ncbi:M23 family metallopeptidase [Microbacterium kribbense]